MKANVEECLKKAVPGPSLSEEQISLCFEYAAEDVPIDLGKLLKSRKAGTLQKGKQNV
jgi:hypothetical protein